MSVLSETGSARAGAAAEAPPLRSIHRRRRRRSAHVALALICLGVVVFAAYQWLKWRKRVSTDDAFIESQVAPVSARVPGVILQVAVADNQRVGAGDVLVQLDRTDHQVRLEQARAALAVAASAKLVAQTAVRAAEVEQEGLTVEYRRKKVLTERRLFAPHDFDRVDVALRTARVKVEASRSKVLEAQARMDELAASLREADLKLQYTTIRAPISGQITKRTAEVGQHVHPGQLLLAIVNLDSVWVVANYKETDLTHVRPGQRAHLTVDRYPGSTFEARVDSIQAGTGSRFALLPAENASGNFVKVVQRIPVKLEIRNRDPSRPLLPGMSVVPVIHLD